MARGKAVDKVAEEMNEIAGRIWDGQSVSLSLIERVGRIKAALIDKGYADKLSNLALPDKGFKKYL